MRAVRCNVINRPALWLSSRAESVISALVTVSTTGLRIDMKTAGMKELIQSVIAEPELRKVA